MSEGVVSLLDNERDAPRHQCTSRRGIGRPAVPGALRFERVCTRVTRRRGTHRPTDCLGAVHR